MTDQISRDVLPIPDRPYEAELPFDARDPDVSFAAIEPLQPAISALKSISTQKSQRYAEGRRESFKILQPCNLARSRSLTTFGFALPFEALITWPTKKPSKASLPER